MKKLVFLLILVCFINPINVYAYDTFNTNNQNEPNQQELYRGSLLSFLYPYISSEVEKYYGYSKGFDLFDAKIISIKKTPEKFEYEIKVQVETFTGAHNSPRGIETITVLTSPIGTKTINFSHTTE